VKGGATEVDVGVDGAKSVIKVESSRDHKWSAKDFSESIRKITVVGIVVIVIVSHHLLSGARMLPAAPPPATACSCSWKNKIRHNTCVICLR